MQNLGKAFRKIFENLNGNLVLFGKILVRLVLCTAGYFPVVFCDFELIIKLIFFKCELRHHESPYTEHSNK